jgi:general secretion pathway protein K
MRRSPLLAKDERGIALVMVIWALALLSLMAASFLSEARVELRRAVNLRERAEAEALAEAGINLALARLVAESGGTAPQSWTERVGGGTVTITLTDERGKIDLNGAEPALIASLFEAVGAGEPAAKALSAAIADFRDADRATATDGAEDAAYPAGSGGAKDAPFETADELMQVRGMTPDLFDRVAPLVTIHSALPTIDPLLAPEGVLRAIPHIDQAELARFLAVRKKTAPILQARGREREQPGAAERRAKAYADLQSALPRRNAVDGYFTIEGSTPPAFTISAEGATATGARYRREVVARPLEGGESPIELLEWRRPRTASGY